VAITRNWPQWHSAIRSIASLPAPCLPSLSPILRDCVEALGVLAWGGDYRFPADAAVLEIFAE